MEELLNEANTLLSKPLDERDLQDLSRMSLIKYRISCLIPFAKKDVKIKELEASKQESVQSKESSLKKSSLDEEEPLV